MFTTSVRHHFFSAHFDNGEKRVFVQIIIYSNLKLLIMSTKFKKSILCRCINEEYVNVKSN